MDALVRRLREHRKSGAYRSDASPPALVAAAQSAGFACYRIDAAPVRSKSDMLGLIARVLGFPAWAGGNWDALEDCLTDLSWIDAPGIVVEIKGFDAYASADPEGFGVLVDIIKAAAEYWRIQRKAFVVLFTGKPAAALALPLFLV